jgi:uncharacterized repeat protein (TIGR03803 family)
MRTRITKPSWGALCAAAVFGLAGLPSSATAQAASFRSLHDFDEDVFDCFTCVMPPVLGQDGVLYGLTNGGGASNWGVLYRVDAEGTYQPLHSFSVTEGAWDPAGQPVQMPNGDLWGVTTDLSARPHQPHGALWRYTKAGRFRVMDRFVGTNGAFPESLVRGPDGRLYGIANSGGDYGKGVLFKVDDTGHVQPIYSFSARAGAITPYMQLTAAADGAFYGVAYSWGLSPGGRVAWRYGADGSFSILHQFGEDYLAGGLVEGPDGALYGATWYGDDKTNCCGTVYRLTKDGSSFSVLHAFNGADGDQPGNQLNVDADGKLVGATSYGGANRYGTVFKLGIDGSGFTKLYDFDAAGGAPSGIDLASDGKGYGANAAGGANGKGNVWQLTLPDF